MRFTLLSVITFALSASCVVADGISLDDLERRSSEGGSEMDRLRNILTDPDTDKAMRAMSIVMQEGSLAQKRAALEAGIGSTNKAIRRTALAAFLDAGPMIGFEFDGSKLQNSSRSNFYSYFRKYGSVQDGVGRYAYVVGPYLEEKTCWAWKVDPKQCMLSLNDENVVLYLEETKTGIGTLSNEGVVSGLVTIPSSTSVPYSFKVSF